MSNITLTRVAAGHYSTPVTADGIQWTVNAHRTNGCVTQSGWVVYRLQRRYPHTDVITDYRILRTLAEAKRFIGTFAN